MFRLLEQVKQKLNIADKDFTPTCNARNQAMFRELLTFCVSLKQLQRVVQTYAKDVPDTLSRLAAMMRADLPRLYQEGPDGLPKPLGDEPVPVGTRVDVDRLSSCGKEFKDRAEKEIQKQIREWLLNFKKAQMDLDQLERMRLALDANRRKYFAMLAKYDQQKKQVENPSSRSSVDLIAAYNKVQNQAETVNATQKMFDDTEDGVAQTLQQLIATSNQIQDQAAALLVALQDCFQSAYCAFDNHMDPDSQTVEPDGRPPLPLVNIPLMDDRSQVDRHARAQELFIAAGSAFADAGKSRQAKTGAALRAQPVDMQQDSARSEQPSAGSSSPGPSPVPRSRWAQLPDPVPVATPAWARRMTDEAITQSPHGPPRSPMSVPQQTRAHYTSAT